MRAYRQLLATPGVPWIVVALVLGGTAGTMAPVSLVLFARAATHSFAVASLVLAALTAGRLVTAPWRGRLVDRRGPAWALLALGAPSLATDVLFIAIGRTHPAAAPLVGAAALAGAVSISPWTAVRSVWATLLPDDGRRRTGMALMSVVAEINFFSGPLLGGVLIAVASPTLAIAVSAALGAVGTVMLAGARATRAVAAHPPAPHGGRLPALAGTAIRVLIASAGLFGLTFGVLDIAWPAFARHHGSAVAAGLFLSLFALGSGVGGLVYGARGRRDAAVRLYPRMALLATLGTLPVLAVSSVAAMAVAAIASGACFAPLSVLQTASVEEVVAAGHRAEAYNWVGTVYGVGSSLGAVLSGQLVAAGPTRPAFAAAALATGLGALLIVAARGALRVSEPPATVRP